MGRKIFVSYKYADDSVENLTSSENSTVRDYVSKFEAKLDSSDHIYKGESDGEDLSNLSEDTIWSKLKDRIYDSMVCFCKAGRCVSGRYGHCRGFWRLSAQ